MDEDRHITDTRLGQLVKQQGKGASKDEESHLEDCEHCLARYVKLLNSLDKLGYLSGPLLSFSSFTYVFNMSALPNEITCGDKLRLLVQYQQTMESYSAAVGALAERYLTEVEHGPLALVAENAREISIEARAALNRHIDEHG